MLWKVILSLKVSLEGMIEESNCEWINGTELKELLRIVPTKIFCSKLQKENHSYKTTNVKVTSIIVTFKSYGSKS